MQTFVFNCPQSDSLWTKDGGLLALSRPILKVGADWELHKADVCKFMGLSAKEIRLGIELGQIKELRYD